MGGGPDECKVDLNVLRLQNNKAIDKNLKNSLRHFACTFKTALNFSRSISLCCRVVQGARS